MAEQVTLFKKRQESHMALVLRDFQETADIDIQMLESTWLSRGEPELPSLQQDYVKIMAEYKDERVKFINMFRYNYEKVDKHYADLLEKNIGNPLFDVNSLPEFINYWATERHQIIGEYYDRRSIELQERMALLLEKRGVQPAPKKKRDSIIKSFARLDDEMRWLKHY